MELLSEVSVARLLSNIRPPTLSFSQSVMAGSLTSSLTSLTSLLICRTRLSSPNCSAVANNRLQSKLAGTDRTPYLEKQTVKGDWKYEMIVFYRNQDRMTLKYWGSKSRVKISRSVLNIAASLLLGYLVTVCRLVSNTPPPTFILIQELEFIISSVSLSTPTVLFN